MRRLSSLVALAFLAGATGAVAGPAASACAGEEARAALVIDTGSAVTTYCVALPDESVTGIDLVELAGDQHGLDYSLGFGGEAVCRLEGVGPEGGDCFGDYPEFWGYWHGNGSGGWTWAGTGAGSASIEDGDVDGWSWGTGDDGSTHQQPPPTQSADVCPVADQSAPGGPRRDRTRARPHADGAAAVDAGGQPVVAPETLAESADPPGRKRRPATRSREKPREPLAPDPPAADAAPTRSPAPLAAQPAADEGGPPVTGLVGLAAATALAAAVWAGSRRRRGS
ncbi:MAG: hypothetical protein ABR613_07695 [Actinomycetota bacterium]